ncbi:prephenate dehydratase [Polychytrium aggregatum]|uniref:prephenate dehydratase n=1 Tax=Polychytrium aggregatum TaxID=110093 RepID=UPI0022FDC8D7|nr:prephenate dehydratase [Polychytrium aggregatum]KAI9199356.1 prephenate dehydratase [Polychytrium aggregatum]
MAAQPIRIAFQGQKGAYSEGAVEELFSTDPTLRSSNFETCGYPSFADVFDAVQSEAVTYGVVPIENSSTGTFHYNYDLLHQYSVYIVGEYCYHEKHCLVGVPGASLETITEIKSHPYAIDQCRRFISKLQQRVAVSQEMDTAGSAAWVASSGSLHSAAIASARAAAIYGLEVITEGIEDDDNTIMRYVVIARASVIPERHMDPRTSISIVLKNQCGAIFKTLSCFALRDINICKVESRPSTRSIKLAKPWEYVLYIDFDGSTADEKVIKALKNIEEFALSIRILGSYPRYQPPPEARNPLYGIGM